MKSIASNIFLYLFILILFTNSNAQSLQELHGTWLTNVDSYVLATDNNIVEAMNYLSSIGVNVIFPVVYNKGYTLYPSQIMQNLFNAKTINDPSFANRDFLERLVIEAHRVGIEVIPWFEFGFSSSYSLNGGHIVARFPSWAAKNVNGQLVVKNGFDWLSGINPDVQNYMISLITEVIDSYDVDGVQGDDRLPAMPVEGGYDSTTVAIYKSEHSGAAPPNNAGDANWKRWRADKLTSFFSRMRDSVKTRSAHLILSSTPTPFPWGYDEYLQDSRSWAQNNLVDNIIPQLYRYDFASYQSTLSQSLSQVRSVNPNIYFAGVLTKSGSYVITPSLLLSKINLNRTNNVKGECTFFYEALRANNNLLGDTLKKSVYKNPVQLPYRNGNIWRPKGNIVNEDSSVVAQIGSWSFYPQQGFNGGILRTNSSTFTSLEYKFNVSHSAHYDVYAYFVPNTTWTQKAKYVIYTSTDSIVVVVNQSDLNKKGWHKIGTAFLTSGSDKKIKLDNSLLEAGKYLVADAMMLMINRKLSPEVVITNVDNKRDEELQTIPSEFVLYQNYPNPFNPTTKIMFSIPAGAETRRGVSLRVFDILGREVATLVNEEKSAGEYEVEFNNSLLPTGIYFYQLRVGDYLATKKMTLLK